MDGLPGGVKTEFEVIAREKNGDQTDEGILSGGLLCFPIPY